MYQLDPKFEDLNVRLPDGRNIGYAIYGNPQGYPIFYFHGFPGSRLEGKLFDDRMKDSSYALYAFDRPGIGNSSHQKNRSLLTWADDVLDIADVLKIRHFSVLGISGGGPYALACAYSIPPTRLDAAMIVSGMGPVESGKEFMDDFLRMGLSLAKKSRLLFRVGYRLIVYTLLKNERRTIKTVQKMVLAMSPDEQAMFRKNGLFEIFVADNYYGFVQGPRGTAQDVEIYSRDWGFELSNISKDLPIFLIHGEADEIVPIQMGQYVASHISHCDSKFYPEGRHFNTAANYLKDLLMKLAKILGLESNA